MTFTVKHSQGVTTLVTESFKVKHGHGLTEWFDTYEAACASIRAIYGEASVIGAFGTDGESGALVWRDWEALEKDAPHVCVIKRVHKEEKTGAPS